MKIIEFFGVPCSGKTYIYNLLTNKFYFKKKKIYTYKSAILNFAKKNKKLNIIENASINYFKFLHKRKVVLKKNKNNQKNLVRKKNYSTLSIFYKNYQKICIFFFNKYKKNNKKFVNIFLNNLNKSSDSKFKKNNYKNWFVEICAAKYLINKNFNDIDYIIDDEGFIQRAFTFALQKKIHQNIDQYLQFVPRPDFVINIKSAKNKIKTRSKLRLNTNNFTYKNDKEINKFFLAETLISSKIIKKTQILPFINKKKNFKKLNSIYEKIKK